VFYKKILILILPVLILVSTINYFSDPAHLFDGGAFESQISNVLLKNQNVANVSNYDERLLQKYFIKGLTLKPEIAILGSSRSMQINQTHFQNKIVINNSVSGGTLKDYLGIFSFYISKKQLPNHLYISLEPWLLNDNNDDSRYKSLMPEYNFMLDLLNLKDYKESDFLNFFLKWKEILSLSYFQNSLKNLGKSNTTYPTNNFYNNSITRIKDGSITYAKKTREISSQEVISLAHDFIKTSKIDYLENYTSLSIKYCKTLNAFIQYLTKNKVQITFILPPYHPVVFEYLSQNAKYAQAIASENYFRELAKKKQF
jgi:hypothetical protein